MLFNNDSSVRIFGIINDVSHPSSDKYQDQIGLQDAYVQWTANLVIADGQLNLSQDFVWVVWLYELMYHSWGHSCWET